eukprot:CAMPEP_0177328474 /NCGR_PEP_ID=MMETSP0368-20130122/19447_1 /TAXON_ID=447022 ORGANISM="Scrippsiella hangoei-like, Strain SHHI-4" /NCGR_SAMPLE_ID=MMETSP0368 /ASSEMBLY_ACC=CAM_ASM_000363 /LENGTH=132 /DNA_ID=CAMNT_0018788613 /DNA_START=193 /DNA_END=588 /DNA_ORIENTATION=-
MSAIRALLRGGMPCFMKTSFTLSWVEQLESERMPATPANLGSNSEWLSIIFLSNFSSSWCQYLFSAAWPFSSRILMPTEKLRAAGVKSRPGATVARRRAGAQDAARVEGAEHPAQILEWCLLPTVQGWGSGL